MTAKRVFDLLASAVGLLLLAPVFFAISIWIKLDSRGPVFFRQERVGQYGRPFRIWKFRSMATDAERKGLQLTVGEDPRITRVGRTLRRYKADELPQLVNVLFGQMSLVGPRPEVPRYVAHYSTEQRERLLSVRPGITDPASIEFVDENELLRGSPDPEHTYVNEVLPRKIRLYETYIAQRTFWGDLALILRTIGISVGRSRGVMR